MRLAAEFHLDPLPRLPSRNKGKGKGKERVGNREGGRGGKAKTSRSGSDGKGREGWQSGGRERKGDRRQGKGRDGSTWISIQGAPVGLGGVVKS